MTLYNAFLKLQLKNAIGILLPTFVMEFTSLNLFLYVSKPVGCVLKRLINSVSMLPGMIYSLQYITAAGRILHSTISLRMY